MHDKKLIEIIGKSFTPIDNIPRDIEGEKAESVREANDIFLASDNFKNHLNQVLNLEPTDIKPLKQVFQHRLVLDEDISYYEGKIVYSFPQWFKQKYVLTKSKHEISYSRKSYGCFYYDIKLRTFHLDTSIFKKRTFSGDDCNEIKKQSDEKQFNELLADISNFPSSDKKEIDEAAKANFKSWFMDNILLKENSMNELKVMCNFKDDKIPLGTKFCKFNEVPYSAVISDVSAVNHGDNFNNINYSESQFKPYENNINFAIPYNRGDKGIWGMMHKTFLKSMQMKRIYPIVCFRSKESPPRKFTAFNRYHRRLHNLESFEKDYPCTIIADTPEISHLNKNISEDIRWTSFYSQGDDLDKIDFKPLKNIKGKLYLLITNHSGLSIEEQVIKSAKLYDYLKDEVGLDLEVLFLCTKYEKINFTSIETLIQAKAHVLPESITLLNDETFKKFVDMAQERLNLINTPFYLETKKENEEDNKKDEISKLPDTEFLLYPILIRKETTIIHARKGVGKTSLALSMVGVLISKSQSPYEKLLFANKWWSVAKGGPFKVLYVYYERFPENLYTTFAKNYLGKNTAKECRKNLITHHQFGVLSDKANHAEFKETVAKANKSGTKGKPIDLMIIDTGKEMMGSDDKDKWPACKQILNEVAAQYNCSILVIFHTDESSKMETNKLSGTQEKIFNASNVISIVKEGGEDPSKVATMSTKYLRNSTQEDFEFKFILDNKENKDNPNKGKWVANSKLSLNDQIHNEIEKFKVYKIKTEKAHKALGMDADFLRNNKKKLSKIPPPFDEN